MRTLLFIFFVLSVVPSSGLANTGPCHTPRSATQHFLDNLQPDQFLPNEAIACFERPSDLSQAELVVQVRRLKAVLDHRGQFVVFEDIPDDHDFRDEQNRQRAEIVPGLSTIHLRRQGVQWRFPATVVNSVNRLYNDTFNGTIDGLIQLMPNWLRGSVLGFEIWQLIGVVGMGVLAFLLGWLVSVVVRQRLVRLFERWGVTRTRDTLATSARPLGVLAGAGLVALLLPELRLPISAARVIFVGLRLVAAVSAVVVLYRLVDLVAVGLAAKARTTASKMDDQIVVLARKSMRVLVVALGAVFILQNLSVNVTSLLAGLGIGGLALALAAKDTAANLFGSLTIFIDAPFYVGDWIKAGTVEGTVQEIGLRSTRVRTFYDSVVSVPNSKLANSNIDNFSRREFRRFKTLLTIGYESTPGQIEAFVEGVRAIITAHPDTRKDAYQVHFLGFGESWLEVLLYMFFDVPSWSDELQARHQVLIEIMRLADALGVEFAFPTRTLHLQTQAAAQTITPGTPPTEAQLTATVHAFGPGGATGNPQGTRLTHGFWAQTNQHRGNEDAS